jgi:hypothetical protein
MKKNIFNKKENDRFDGFELLNKHEMSMIKGGNSGEVDDDGVDWDP